MTHITDIRSYCKHLVEDRIKTINFTSAVSHDYVEDVTDVVFTQLYRSPLQSEIKNEGEMSSTELTLMKTQIKEAVTNAMKVVRIPDEDQPPQAH